MRVPHLIRAFPFALLVLPLGAQSPSTLFDPGYIAPPPSVLLGSLGRAEAGQITTDGHPDPVFVANGTVHLAYGVDAYRDVFDLGVPASDLAVVPGASPRGFDIVASTHPGGGHVSWFDASDGSLTSVAVPGLASALRLRAGDIGRDGAFDLFTLDAGGTSFTWHPNLTPIDLGGGAWSVSPGNPIPYPAGIAVFDFVQADFDSQAPDDVICLEYGAVARLRPDGTRTVLATYPGSPKALATFRQLGWPFDRIAVAYRDGARDYLLVLDSSGPAEPPVDMGDVGAIALQTGDADGDGFDDLFFGLSSGDVVLRYHNTGTSGASFALGVDTTFEIDVDDGVTSIGPTGAWPYSADFDQDGDVDLFYGVEASGDLYLGANNRFDEALVGPQYSSAVKSYVGAPTGSFFYEPTYKRPVDVPANLDEIELRAWVSYPPDYPLPQVAEAPLFVPATTTLTTVQVEVVEDEIDDGDAVYVCFARFVQRDAAGLIVDWSPTYASAVAAGNVLVQYAADNGYDAPGPNLIEVGSPGGGEGIGTGDVPVEPPPDWGGGGSPHTPGGGSGTGGGGGGGL
ncbi:MAG: hypothetical protein AAF682_12320 [Planctomycetota bacterium]